MERLQWFTLQLGVPCSECQIGKALLCERHPFKSDTVHEPSITVIIVDSQMLDGAVVPECQ